MIKQQIQEGWDTYPTRLRLTSVQVGSRLPLLILKDQPRYIFTVKTIVRGPRTYHCEMDKHPRWLVPKQNGRVIRRRLEGRTAATTFPTPEQFNVESSEYNNTIQCI